MATSLTSLTFYKTLPIEELNKGTNNNLQYIKIFWDTISFIYLKATYNEKDKKPIIGIKRKVFNLKNN